jgi:hypothetical protein
MIEATVLFLGIFLGLCFGAVQSVVRHRAEQRAADERELRRKELLRE